MLYITELFRYTLYKNGFCCSVVFNPQCNGKAKENFFHVQSIWLKHLCFVQNDCLRTEAKSTNHVLDLNWATKFLAGLSGALLLVMVAWRLTLTILVRNINDHPTQYAGKLRLCKNKCTESFNLTNS